MSEDAPMLLHDAVEQFAQWSQDTLAKRTAQTYAMRARQLSRAFGPDASLEVLTVEKLRAYVAAASDGKAPGTQYNIIASLRKFCEFLRLRHLKRGQNPASKLKFPTLKTRPKKALTQQEIKALFAATYKIKRPYRASLARAALSLLTYTGLRRAEVLALDVTDVYLPQQMLYIRAGKGDKEGFAALNTECCQYLTEYLALRPKDCQHLGLLARTTQSRLGEHALYTLLDQAAQLANVEAFRPDELQAHVRPHKFRHAFATRMSRQGASLEDVRVALRHERIETTARYVKSDLERMHAISHLASLTEPETPEPAAKLERRRQKRGLRRVATKRGG